MNQTVLLKTIISLGKVAAFSAVSGGVLWLTNHPSAFGFETVGVLAAGYEVLDHIKSWKTGGDGEG